MSDFSVNISGFGDLTKKLNELGVNADEEELASLFEYKTQDKGLVEVDDFAKDVAALYDTNDYVAVCSALDEAASLYGDNDFLSIGDIEAAQENDFNELLQQENVRETITDILNGYLTLQNANLQRSEDNNSGLTKLFDGVVGLFGGDKSTASAQKEIDEAQKSVASLKEHPEKLPEVYKQITGNELTVEEFEKLCNAKQDYSKSEIGQAVDGYQKTWNKEAKIDVTALPATFPTKAQELRDEIKSSGIKTDIPDYKTLAVQGKELNSKIQNVFTPEKIQPEEEVTEKDDKYDFKVTLTPEQKTDLENFKSNYKKHYEEYKETAQKAGVSPELIAAIHWRESSGDFSTYLHNGQPLGQVTTIEPKGIYFDNWEDAAVDAVKNFYWFNNLDPNSFDSCLDFAEHYNGMGYSNNGLTSPYVWSGTDKYQSGKFVEDGVLDLSVKDEQLGVAVMLRALEDNQSV